MIQHIHAIEKTGEPMEKQRTFPPKQPKLIEDSACFDASCIRFLATKHLFRLHRFRIRIFTDQPGPGRRRPIPGNLARCHGCKILHLWLMNFQLWTSSYRICLGICLGIFKDFPRLITGGYMCKNIVKSEPMFIYHVAFLGHIELQNVSNAQTELDQPQAAQSLLHWWVPPMSAIVIHFFCSIYRPHAESEMPLNRCGSVSKPCTPGEHQNSW